MAKVVWVSRIGNSDVLQLKNEEPNAPGADEAWVEHEAIGVNYLDVMQRRGDAPLAVPGRLGLEGAGRVTAVGSNVTAVKVGDRVGYALGPIGSYATGRLYPAARLVKLPAGLSSADAAALLFKGITAQYLLKSTFRVGPGDTVLVYGAAGGLGQLLVPWAKHLGATVIGVVSKIASVDLASSAGCDAVLVWGNCNVASEVSRLTGGRKADVVYDGIGKTTFIASLDSLRSRGMMVSLGASSGLPDPVPISYLHKDSLFLTRPALAAHATSNDEYRTRAQDVLDAASRGIIKPSVSRGFALSDVSAAHRALERGGVGGSVILIP